ncbi:MAG: transposase [Cyanobacteria bacterium J06560_5]
MSDVKWRAFQAEITLKYCNGSARLAESQFGWSRRTVSVGLAEKRTGVICQGAQSVMCGNKRWEAHQPEAASALQQLAEAHAQQEPSFTSSSIAFTRLTAAEALRQLKAQGFRDEQLPAASTMTVVLNRLGYRFRKVVKVKPEKKSLKPTRYLRTLRRRTHKRKPN